LAPSGSKIRHMNRELKGCVVVVNGQFEIYWFLSLHNDIIQIRSDHGDAKKNTVTDVSGHKRWTLRIIAGGK
jgi:hypothetical protein